MKGDPFKYHGIGHLSPSSLNLFAAEPAFWTLKYLWKVRDDVGDAAHRGTAVEAGVEHLLGGQPLPVAEAVAQQNFSLNYGDADSDERRAIRPMLEQAAAAVSQFGKPIARQKKVEHRVDGIEVPIVGYLDWEFEDGVIDLKTTHRLPSAPRQDHVRQVALYTAATGKPSSLVYVTTKKFAVYPISPADSEAALQSLVRTARAVRKVLYYSATREEVAEFFSPNFESFYWNDETKKHAMEVF